ncbi:MAG: hypothetical protein HKO89_02825 [Saprospiraceae bacterium]|nr:hypothetical protein [Saprospiraceae bacterium]
MQRPERIVIVSVSSILCGLISHLVGSEYEIVVDWFPQPIFEMVSIFAWPIFFLAISANVTALRRLSFAKRKLMQ